MKKTKLLLSVIAGILFCVMSLSSCAVFPNKEDSPYIEGQRLTVTESEIKYSESEKNEIILNLTNIASEIIFMREGLALTESEKNKLALNIKDLCVEIFESSNVSYKKLSEFLNSVERLILEENAFTYNMFSNIYLSSMGLLGREISSELIFKTTVVYLNKKAEIFEERYESYGYQWYLDDSKTYFRLSSEIQEGIGADKFTDALGVVFFTASILSGTPVLNENSELLLDNAELLALVKRQAKYFDENSLSSSQWQTVFEVLFELFFTESEAPEHFDAVEREEYLALRNNRDYAVMLGGIMPYVTNLYVDVVNNLSSERFARLLSEDKAVAGLEFLNSLYLCKNRFLPLSSKFSMLRFVSESEKNALVRAEAYDDYLKYEKYRKDTDGSDLYNAIGAYLSGRIGKEQLNGVFENYMFASAPYFTYVFLFDNRK